MTNFLDGGWTKIKAGCKEGLVPTAYIELSTPTATNPPAINYSTRPSSAYSNSGSSIANSVAPTSGTMSKKKGPAVAPKRGGKKLKYVEALYEYAAQSEVEHNMMEGERFVLVKEDPGDGWVEVEKGGITRSVPANYVHTV